MNKNNSKFKKIISIIFFNLIAIIALWIISDVCIYITSLKLNNQLSFQNLKDFYKKPTIPINDMEHLFLEDYQTNENMIKLRKPNGLQFKSSPILLFGCSFAFGHYLKYNQNFSYKLSNQLKRPVYNRSIPGSGIQQMYYQTTRDEFYKIVHPCNTVIHVFMDAHFKRMLGHDCFIHGISIFLHYKYKNGKLIMDNYNNPFVVFNKYNYTLRAIRRIYNEFYLKNPKNVDRITNEALSYFLKIRENLENSWHNKVKFIVLFYTPYMRHEQVLMNKLRENNFIVISTDDLTNEDLHSKKYKLPDEHPNEEAWDLLTPLFIEKMKQEKVF
ncbi:hypothetical protein IJG14_05655 [bacterium]|nr:hypothetical protein [bacterium]